MDSGKDFEYRISRSLHALKGASMKVEDGGRYAYNRQLCDFLYWPDTCGTIALECKAVKGKSLPLSRLGIDKQGGQLDRLLEWADRYRKPVLAVCYYDTTVAKGRCYIVPVRFLLGLEKASLSEAEATMLGYRCPKVGDHYDMTALEEWFDYRGGTDDIQA